ncbi:MAG: tRNA-dihydrouridine synthase family protein [Candidatus Hermodarchaeota archaeon]
MVRTILESSKNASKPCLFLAPMVGYSSLPFRALCQKNGADIVCTEMIHLEEVLKGKIGTGKSQTSPIEHPVGIQLLCKLDPVEPVLQAIEQLQETSFDFIDLNFGCNDPSVIRKGEGAFLLKNPSSLRKPLKDICSISSKPISIKSRLGWNSDCSSKLLSIFETVDIAWWSLHARLGQENYSAAARWEQIRNLATSSLQIVGNGDIFNYQSAMTYYQTTGVVGVMIGRAAQGNPFIFSPHIPTEKERLLAFREFLLLAKEYNLLNRGTVFPHLKMLRSAFPKRFYYQKLLKIQKIRELLTYLVKFYPNEFEHIVDSNALVKI